MCAVLLLCDSMYNHLAGILRYQVDFQSMEPDDEDFVDYDLDY